MSSEVSKPSVNNVTEGSELEQAVDALAKMGLKVEKELKCKELCQLVPLSAKKQETVEEVKESKRENDENKQSNQANCSACMKIIQNPLSEGHGIVHGHVGQFKMLIPWTREADDGGVLCSRCYQRNWRLNKQRTMSEERDTHEETYREPYLCLCGMTFHSSQLKAAHCRLCQKYREIADQEQRQEGKGSPSKTSNTKDCAGQKRSRPSSDQPIVRRSSEPSTSKKERMDVIFSTPPPMKIRPVETTPASCFVNPQQDNAIPQSPCSNFIGGLSCKPSSSSFVAQKMEVAQLLLTARLLGQIDFIQYANLAKMVSNTTEKALLTEVSQLVLNYALKPLMCSTQFFGSPPQPSTTKLSCFENEDKPLSSLSLLPHVMLHSMK